MWSQLVFTPASTSAGHGTLPGRWLTLKEKKKIKRFYFLSENRLNNVTKQKNQSSSILFQWRRKRFLAYINPIYSKKVYFGNFKF